MDPDAARAELCRLSTEIGHAETDEEIAVLAEEMATVWDGLDAWMRLGGDPPKVWRDGR